MSEVRIHREAQKEKQIKLDIEYYRFLQELNSLMEGIDELSDEEKTKRQLEYNTKIEERLNQLHEEIKAMENKYAGTPWNFSHERAMEVFAEDNDIILRDYKESELDKYIQIKIENTDSPVLFESEEQKRIAWNIFYSDSSFCCAIIRKIDNELIGYVSVKDSRSNLWEISIELLQEHCDRGYGTKAMGLFLPSISKITGKTQFQALVETDNIPSQMLMEKLGARLIDIYDYTFNGDEDEAEAFEEKHLDRITDRMIELAGQINVEPRKMLSHVLDYRFFIEEGKIANKRR